MKFYTRDVIDLEVKEAMDNKKIFLETKDEEVMSCDIKEDQWEYALPEKVKIKDIKRYWLE